MRLLKLLSRILRLTNRHNFSRERRGKSIWILTAFLLAFASCQITRDADNGQFGLKWIADIPSKISSAAIGENHYIRLLHKTSSVQKSSLIAEFDASACKNGRFSGEQSWRIFVNSVFGRQDLRVKLMADAKAPSAEISTDDMQFLIDVTTTPSLQLADSICEAYAHAGGDIETNLEHIIPTIHSWLSALSPDCNFDFKLDRQWYCAVETTSATEAANELDSIRRNMIRRWNRQPYILTRRLAIARNLAAVLSKRQHEKELGELCDVLQASSPSELPVALKSARWRFAVCDQTKTHRTEAAHIGLTKALAEIEYLRRLFESSSKMGYLSLKVPKDQAPSKDLWVSLEPLEDVAENIISFSGSLGAAQQEIKSPRLSQASKDGCWHPLFGEREADLLIAKKLELTGATPNGSSCHSAVQADNKLKKQVFKYFADSITSETEFVITNGNGKLLRLPPGTYRYTLRQHHTDLLEMNAPESLPSAQGTISWQHKRPRATIKHW